MKKKQDYDNTFKTLKSRHQRLFIAVINEAFGKHYSLNSSVETLPSEGVFLHPEKPDTEEKIEKRENDFLLRIGDDYYLLECQSYDDESMSIRIAEYTFLAARSRATYNQGEVILPMPHFTVIYIKNTDKTPRMTKITYRFPGGFTYSQFGQNIFLSDLSKEEIIEKELYVYIPFYIARYEKELKTGKDYEKAIKDLEYFREKMLQLRQRNQLNDVEIDDLRDCVNQIVLHITDGNEIEEEVVSVMGGEVFELHSERIVREATERYKKENENLKRQLQKMAEKDQEIKELNENIEEKEKSLKEKDKSLKEKDKSLKEKDKSLKEKDKSLKEKDKKIAELEAYIRKNKK